MPLDSSRTDNRRQDILLHAMRLFGAKGYERTSIRDIAAAVGILPGSVYHHFESKDALLVAVYAEGIDQAIAAVQSAVAGHRDPWDRLESASVAHLRLLLDRQVLAAVVVDGPNQPAKLRAQLVRQRDRYEAVFRTLVEAVALPPGVEPGPFRLALLGALNWTLTWYRPGGESPDSVARSLFAVFKASKPTRTEPVTAP